VDQLPVSTKEISGNDYSPIALPWGNLKQILAMPDPKTIAWLKKAVDQLFRGLTRP
jgi:hypothetical protein